MSASSASSGGWIPLMDYAMKKGVSLSTLRRYIKANKIRFKTEQGRYLIWDEDHPREAMASPAPSKTGVSAGGGASAPLETASSAQTDRKIEELEQKLLCAQEEISELKMLVDLYEEQLFSNKTTSLGL